MNYYHDYAEQFLDSENKVYAGLSYPPNFYDYGQYFKTHKITVKEEYRPDKIANTLWHSGDSAWILDLINDFQHGISEYTRNREIKYIEYDILLAAGVI